MQVTVQGVEHDVAQGRDDHHNAILAPLLDALDELAVALEHHLPGVLRGHDGLDGRLEPLVVHLHGGPVEPGDGRRVENAPHGVVNHRGPRGLPEVVGLQGVFFQQRVGGDPHGQEPGE